MSEDKDQVRRGGPALEKAYRFLLWVVPALEKFPRSQRFLLGDRIETTALTVLEKLVDATYSRQVETTLREVNLALERLRFLFRLSKDLHYLDLKRYEYVAREIDEIGRLVGGWLRTARRGQGV
jgi:23S rRNA-intervening sequence protein